MIKGHSRENEINVEQLIAAEAELAELKEECGIIKKKGIVTKLFDKLGEREEISVDRRTYLLLNVFLGWAGGHRFYSKRYVLGILYLALCWTGISVAMSIIDIMVAVPKPVDDNGMIAI